ESVEVFTPNREGRGGCDRRRSGKRARFKPREHGRPRASSLGAMGTRGIGPNLPPGDGNLSRAGSFPDPANWRKRTLSAQVAVRLCLGKVRFPTPPTPPSPRETDLARIAHGGLEGYPDYQTRAQLVIWASSNPSVRDPGWPRGTNPRGANRLPKTTP